MRDKAIAKINAEMQKNPNDYCGIHGCAIMRAAADRLDELSQRVPQWIPVTERLPADVTLACTALRYVAEFAADKCRMIPVPNPRPGKEKENGGIY